MDSRNSDSELIALEMETLWTRDERGRLVRDGGLNGASAPLLAVGCAADGGQVVAVGERVPVDVGPDVEAILRAGSGPPTPGRPPAGLAECEKILASAIGPVEARSGPSYVVEAAPQVRCGAEIWTSAAGRASELPPPPREAGWTAEEWALLTGGALGPWAMAVVDGVIASICFSARFTDEAAEAGLRTEPEHRRQGYGAAVTGAWAGLVLESGRVAFYSTSRENVASQRVAGRLGLREVGWLWSIRAVRREQGHSTLLEPSRG